MIIHVILKRNPELVFQDMSALDLDKVCSHSTISCLFCIKYKSIVPYLILAIALTLGLYAFK